MLNDATRARLRRLVGRTSSDAVCRAMLPRRSSSVVKEHAVAPDVHPRGLDTGLEVTNSAGKHLLIRRNVATLWPELPARMATWRQTPEHDETAAHEAYRSFRESFPQRSFFLDLETCGFAGSMIFLAGIIHVEQPSSTPNLILSQLWARNYAEERAMLVTLREYLKDQQVLVTFNGKSFDWPQVRDRCVLHERDPRGGLPEIAHLDLLHLSRRRWKKELPNCKLQTLERYICGRSRTGDVPGREIPDVYHRYVRTGDDRMVGSILYHNALDLVTLLQLALRIGAVVA